MATSRESTDVPGGARVYHYSRSVRLEAVYNQIFALLFATVRDGCHHDATMKTLLLVPFIVSLLVAPAVPCRGRGVFRRRPAQYCLRLRR